MSPFYELLQISLSTRDSFTTLPTTEQWAEIFNEADRQCVLGIMCVGVEKVVQRCGGLEKSRIDPDLFATWYSYTQKTKERNLELNRKSAWLQNWLSKQGFSSCILKGQGNALMYPDPLLRTSGDIDVWMWKKEYDESHLTGRYSGSQNREDIVQWVLGKMNGKYAEIAVHHVQMEPLGGVEVEGHYWPNFFFSRPRMKDFERYCEEEHLRQMTNWKPLPLSLSDVVSENVGSLNTTSENKTSNASSVNDPLKRISAPTPEFNMIFQLLHVMRHLFHDGIGLKQMIDYYWLLNSQEMDMEEVRRLVRRFSLTHIVEGMMWMMHHVLGMPEERLPFPMDEKVGRILLSEIDRGGNLGWDDLGLHQWRFKSSLQMFIWRTYRDITLIRICPSEVLWSPYFRFWQKMWVRKMEKKAALLAKKAAGSVGENDRK